MKTFKIFFAVMITVFAMTARIHGQTQQAPVEISFVFTRQPGVASNQYAVWIEDASGAVVKTVFATRYTAKGGWKVRAQSIPQWVKQSGVASLSAAEIDVFTSATPAAGTVTYTWDGTDKNGKKVSTGEYRIFLEASLRWGGRVVYSAATRANSTGALALEEHYYDGGVEVTGTKIPGERKMISNVKMNIK